MGFALYESAPFDVQMVYYHIPSDQIFMSANIDVHFFNLIPGVKWNEIEILGLM